ncbi:MAG: tRNA (N6-threonylcarbamoyladenosine(37)-N6)-methyltransferase TrmO, partial [Verrucomicrobiae bacterium]|nr:tRNA (N6-threonylcarbamoyladenosine(37)-N6)-methyltransferase TrmO [Verrucomicrobiae bacterium]NNJ85646.1 tRNA (N6-threonylcarbamoyladenosine(37)-N6)-methyltransferase TrmO [Akkermansiaceae bacterium]
WLMFVFHQAMQKGEEEWQPTVRPPRLGGNRRMGVFASRSPFRPNPIGLSCVQLESIDLDHADAPVLRLRGVDIVTGTPILDIKPYIPYSDSLPRAIGGFANSPPDRLNVIWDDGVSDEIAPETMVLIEKTLSLDPRPAYQHGITNKEYGCLINGHNVRWKITSSGVLVISCDAAG